MEAAVILLLCAAVAVDAQFLNPVSPMGMGSGWVNPMWHSGVRYPGMMQTSQFNSMIYPTWRSHPLFRTVFAEKSVGPNPHSDVINIPKVPSTQEVLTHMALANQNPKPYLDTISDFLYEPQKTRAVLTPVTSVASVAPVASVTPVASVSPVAPVAAVSSVASPYYMQGVNVVRASELAADDCGPLENARWERGMDWLY